MDIDGVDEPGSVTFGTARPPTGRALTDPNWESWATGVQPPSPDGSTTVRPSTAPSPGRVLVFQDENLVETAVRYGWVGHDDTVLPGPGTGPHGWVDRPYGLAGWVTAPEPHPTDTKRDTAADGLAASPASGSAGPRVVLRIDDDHDLSAFLREADRAMSTGIFADHLLRPDTLVGDLSCLGADFAAAGPDHRLWVAADGHVSTSRSGAELGRIDEPPGAVAARWRARNDDGARPCAVGLAKVLDERDRAEALADRPWMGRYHSVVRAMRRLRGRGLSPVAASGFGRRLDRRVAAAQPGPVVDDPGAPLLLVTRDAGRNRHWVVDPDSAVTRSVDAAAAVQVEHLLAFRSHQGAGLVEPSGARGGRPPAEALDDLVGRLADAGICPDWFGSLEGGARPLEVGRSVFG